MPLINFENPTNLSGYTLIIPSVSVGNVAQLTVDLLITNYNFKKVATLWHPALVASVGADPYFADKNEVCIACEMYCNSDLKLATIQLRSTIETKLMSKFFGDLKESLGAFNLKSVVILTSGFDYELRNITSDKFFFACDSNSEEIVKATNIKLLEKNLNDKIIVSGSGFAIKLYEILSDKISCLLLVKYVSEGDNRPDAYMMLEKLFAVGGVPRKIANLRMPSSWQYVFGGPPPIGMF